MKKLIILLIIFFSFIKCTDENSLLKAYKGDRELNEGEQVPFVITYVDPNPARSLTSIHFKVSEVMHLKMELYSEDWYRIAILTDRIYEIGDHHVRLDGRKENLPVGEFFCILKGGGYKQIVKLKIIK